MVAKADKFSTLNVACRDLPDRIARSPFVRKRKRYGTGKEGKRNLRKAVRGRDRYASHVGRRGEKKKGRQGKNE